MKAEIIAIGSELVNGQKLDTNSQWLSQRLEDLGIPVRFHESLGDDLDENVEGFRVALGRAGLVIVTGGLGPTQDDLTREALALVAGTPLVEDVDALEAIESLFARRGRPMSPRNRVQALRPEGSVSLPNAVGTAPGVWFRVGESWIACLPGVPYEMKAMFDESVVPLLRAEGLTGRVIVHHVINLYGRGESDIEAEAMDLTARGRQPEVGITASDATISFRISSAGPDEDAALLAMQPTLDEIRRRFTDLIVGEGTEDVVHALVRVLREGGRTLAVAESCTGGLVAQRITALSGVSACFPGGVVTYSNEAKHDLLGVSTDLIASEGAVSLEVAKAMAAGVRDRFHADFGLAITGVAGPTGGSPGKPIGLVYLGLASPSGVLGRRLELGPEQPRSVIQSRAAKHAMNWARLLIVDEPPAPSA